MSQDPVHNVFQNELLREKILGYVIHAKNEVSYVNVRSCRLVKKAWMHSTSKFLRKCREPLFQLHLNKDNSLSKSAFVAENGKLLDKFISAVTGTSRLEEKIPTFKIKTSTDFFRQENHKSFLECLTRCGGSLVDMDINFPYNGGSMTFTFPLLAFEKLKKIRIHFSVGQLDEGLAVREPTLGVANGAYLLQFLLNGCKDLQTLILTSAKAFRVYGIDCLALPTTLNSLELDISNVESKHFELVSQSDLPKLKELRLLVGGPLPNGLMFKILEKVKTTLTHLWIDGMCHEGEEKVPSFFRLPKMEHLEQLYTPSIHLELEGGVHTLQECVPNLQKLLLLYQTTSMFQKWTQGSKYASVNELTVGLVDESENYFSDNFEIDFSSEMMQLVKLAFPNIQTLDITVCGAELSGLKYAFANLKTIQILKVRTKGCRDIVNSDCWDALLIGTPTEFGTALRTTPDFWSNARFLESEKYPSIKKLTELKELHLCAPFQAVQTPQAMQLKNSLISDVAFLHAFLEMPKLKQIYLYGRFKASSAMRKRWRKQSEEHKIRNYKK